MDVLKIGSSNEGSNERSEYLFTATISFYLG